MEKIYIIACDAFSYELDKIMQDEDFKNFPGHELSIIYLSQKLHTDFDEMKKHLLAQFAKTGTAKTLLLYGCKCHPDFASFLPENTFTMPQKNCIHALTDIDTEKSTRSFFLTPMQMLNWHRFFGFDNMTAAEKTVFREKFCHYCDSAIFADTGSMPVSEDIINYFSQSTGLPVETKHIEPDIFKNNLTDMIKKVCR